MDEPTNAGELIEEIAEDLSGGRDYADIVVRTADWLNPLLASPAAPFEAVAAVAAFEPTLMPRSSVHQGLAVGAAALAARALAKGVDMATRGVLPKSSGLPLKLTARAAMGGAGVGLASLSVEPDENLWRSGARSAGQIMAAAAASGAVYDAASALAQSTRHGNKIRPILVSAAIFGGLSVWGARALQHRKSVMPRWPKEQPNKFPQALGIGYGVYGAGVGLGKAYVGSRNAIVDYLGPGPSKRVIGGLANAALWAAGAAAAYNAGVGYVGRSNENIEPAYSMAPLSPLVSGSEDSVSAFDELGLQGRRYVTDVTSAALIEEVMGEPAVATPIRTYIGYNSEPVYQMGRTEMAVQELERTGAFERSHLLLISPTGTGWVDQTMIESAEFLARGDIATCVVQYGRFPSFLSVQKVALGRRQFRALLWSIRNRLASVPEEDRPKIYVFGESLGAWASSDVVMYLGIDGFDHYGIDKALWVGLPGMAKWSRNGMAAGRNEMVPDGSVRIFDHPDELNGLDSGGREKLRATILSHHNDPIAVMAPELMLREPEWLSGERGRGVPDDLEWFPFGTFLHVMVDAMNAMVTVPGKFGSFGHDYRADMARMVSAAYDLPATEAQLKAIEDALVTLELERADRIAAAKAEDAPAPPEYKGTHLEDAQTGKIRVEAGEPLEGKRTDGAKWLASIVGEEPPADIQ